MDCSFHVQLQYFLPQKARSAINASITAKIVLFEGPNLKCLDCNITILHVFLTSLVPNPPVTTFSWPGTQPGEAQILRDIYETERSVISCQHPLVPLTKQGKGSTFLLGDNSQANWMTLSLKATTTRDHSSVCTETCKQWFYVSEHTSLGQIYISFISQRTIYDLHITPKLTVMVNLWTWWENFSP